MSYSRKKSCEQCRAAKTRCSLTFPTCTRCTSRGSTCIYKDVTLPNIQPLRERDETLSTAAAPSSSDYNGFSFTTTAQVPPSHTSTIPTEHAPGAYNNYQTTEAPFDSLFGSPLDLDTFSPSGPSSSSTTGSGSGSGSTSDRPHLFDPDPTSANPRFTLARTPSTASAALLSRVVHGSLATWPRMLVEGLALPPYVHATCLRTGTRECEGKGKHVCWHGPLDNACGVVQMSLATTVNNFGLLSTTGHYEQKRMLSEFEGYGKWMLLECFQTMALYTLMYSLLTDEQKVQCDGSIVVALGIVANRVLQRYGLLCDKEKSGGFPSWEEWIYAESVRRTTILLFILGRLLDMRITPTSTSSPSPSTQPEGLDAVPLPATKDLWEARTRIEWERKYQEYLRAKSGREVMTIGHLRSVRNGVVEDDALLRNLGLWCFNLDQFGTTVWNAAGLLGGD
ncbi:hypothetical protein EJ05DRAFT_503539 [Pseudovirgaria hyperparasitica]|uniref:Zn(2)-C6 fungal-type domain-containing protein n=1 Tax=Pseudovirgaria hyperparasitica TaxID=470096 RepID=A0A6A6VZR4_9PEZI|nr:uncharacterized protein EJ05DRAFT_503539 [Pseudovirgaria hyperparasitica]KAF2755234.1 hypothetical protein EJ05DRAFT_503539 [Pseudovirgaria hyperparasitica]